MADMTYKKFQKQENSMKSLKSFSLYLHAMTSDGKNTNHKRIPTKRKDRSSYSDDGLVYI